MMYDVYYEEEGTAVYLGRVNDVSEAGMLVEEDRKTHPNAKGYYRAVIVTKGEDK